MSSTDSDTTETNEFLTDNEEETVAENVDAFDEKVQLVQHLHIDVGTKPASWGKYATLLRKDGSLDDAQVTEIVDTILVEDMVAQLFQNIPIAKLEVFDKKAWIGLSTGAMFFYVIAVVNIAIYGSLVKGKEKPSRSF